MHVGSHVFSTHSLGLSVLAELLLRSLDLLQQGRDAVQRPSAACLLLLDHSLGVCNSRSDAFLHFRGSCRAELECLAHCIPARLEVLSIDVLAKQAEPQLLCQLKQLDKKLFPKRAAWAGAGCVQRVKATQHGVHVCCHS